MYDTILCPTDGSELSKVALEEAIDHAEVYNADIHIMYVLPQSETAAVSEMGIASSGIEEIADAGEELVQSAADEAESNGIDTTTVVRTGAPHRQIADYADANNIEMIMMGTHGRSGAKRVILGSTTERVIRATDASVLTVKN